MTTDQTPTETFAAIRALLAWYDAAPDALLNIGGDGLLEFVYEVVDDILSYDPVVRSAVELLQRRDEQEERAENPELCDTDYLDLAFWDRVEGKQ